MPTILLVDDEPAIRESLGYALGRDGFKCVEAGTLGEAWESWETADLIVLDLMLPDGNGIDFLSAIRAKSQVPVIVLTSREEVTDRVVGLEVGADDYVVKPFSPREIVARVRAVLRRLGTNGATSVSANGRPADSARNSAQFGEDQGDALVGPGELRLDPSARRAWRSESELQLSRTEFELLMVFLRSPGRVFERGHLLQKVWGPDCSVGERTVDVHLKALRTKIEQAGGDPEVLETVRGVGYRLRDEEA